MCKSISHVNALMVGAYANSIIKDIQKNYTGKNPRAKADARATLARLRRSGTSAYSPWMDIGQQMFSNWPEDKLGDPREDSYAIRAIQATLQLYAFHQQSQSSPMAAVIDKGSAEEQRQKYRYATFGAACRRVNLELDSSQGIRRRLESVYAASDFDGIVRNIRALIALIKSGKQSDVDKQIDYGQLGLDLFLMQFEDDRKKVFFRWGRDYFYLPTGSKSLTSKPSQNKDAK
ncbi:hypothetical protein KIM372_02730 [Bombiscardovia nodaiensis]|uniref:Type I-E CRISPR-associated protein Cse2/CasB n=1 Tax=Bombiscardovia nodaiensis TaxID=2932181 RepID=A0ABM8B6G8_9BIFI|nr:hypothetical protein KIM372_02730 [Bombiscardovia nodaiensis]